MVAQEQEEIHFEQIVFKVLSIIIFLLTSVFSAMVIADLDFKNDLANLLSMKYAIWGSVEFGKDGLFFFTYCLAGYVLSVIFAINSDWVVWKNTFFKIAVSIVLLLIFIVFLIIPSVITPLT